MVTGHIVHGQPAPPEDEIAMLKATVAACWGVLASVTRAVNVKLPAVVGEPLMTPVLLLRESPVGRAPPEIAHV